MIKFIFLHIFGWRIVGFTKLPKKCILIAAPHTHWVDFFLGLAIKYSINENLKFLAKKELFFIPLNILMNYLGGIPVKRDSNTNTVDQISRFFNEKNEFKLAISPEGTRKKVEKWKTRKQNLGNCLGSTDILYIISYPYEFIWFLTMMIRIPMNSYGFWLI